MARLYRVVLVLTAGFRPGTGEPSNSGVLRLQAADEEIRSGRVQAAMIVGGNRIAGLTEAESYHKYAAEHLPALAGKIILVDAKGMFTVEDVILAAPEIDAYLATVGEKRSTTKFFIPTYFKHYRRIWKTIKRLGFAPAEWIDSGERQIFSDLAENIMYFFAVVDPLWRTWLSRPLVKQARKRFLEVIP